MERIIVLAGNPNVGKSVFFNALTGSYQADVSNFPGTTVELTQGLFQGYRIVDTPGVFGLSADNEEERVAGKAILSADQILNVVDAVNLKRDLFLTLQLAQLGKPMLVALNLMDDASRQGMVLDVKALQRELGVPVIPTSGRKGTGMEQVKTAVTGHRFGIPRPVRMEEEPAAGRFGCAEGNPAAGRFGYAEGNPAAGQFGCAEGNPTADRFGCAEGNPTAGRFGCAEGNPAAGQFGCAEGNPAAGRFGHTEEHFAAFRPGGVLTSRQLRLAADRLADLTVKQPLRKPGLSDRLGRAFLNPVVGLPLLTLMLAAIFLVFGKVLAQRVVSFTQTVVMGTWYFNWITGLLYPLLDPDSLPGSLLVGEYGLLTMVPIYLLGLLLPLVTGFYFLISLLEDWGLLPRMAVLCDRLFTRFGLNGKAIIPTLLGFGCVTMALVTTRILGSRRERLIASVLLCIAVPCSAQFAIILAAAAFLKLPYLLVYSGAMALIFFLTGSLLNLLLPGSSTDLFLTLPPMRLPAITNLMKKTARKTRQFLWDTGSMFLLGSVIITVLNDTGGFAALHRFLSPLTQSLLGLPRETSALFIMSIIKRDLGAAGLYSMMEQGLFTQPQLTVALIVMTLFVPCFASLFILGKEQGKTVAALIWLGSFLMAFTAGAAASLFLR